MTVDHRCAAQLEIRNIVARLAQFADSGDADEYLSLLTDDAVWSMPANPSVRLEGSERRGRDAIAAGIAERIAAGLQGPGSDSMHVITTTAITMTDDDSAQARSYFTFWTTTSTAPTPTSMGRYDDTFRRTTGGWKLAVRRVSFG